MSDRKLTTRSNTQAIDQFIDQAAKLPVASQQQGRILFALDATASRQPTWDMACNLHSELFLATESVDGIAIQLCYYCGFREFKATDWVTRPERLLNAMNRVQCLGGQTQIGRVLQHALKETRVKAIKAVILIVDCCEEAVDPLCQHAGELGLLNTPLFIFQEGNDAQARNAFQQMAKLSGGAWMPFDNRAAAQLKDLLGAVAVYASGGQRALDDLARSGSADVKRLTQQLKR
ncbi:VWA domain-containing protein [Saccharospirillum alexandrii]|uniref:VWA domain-containing protein n=1 Tax=Saccharospirillum alexandrii TaxID=2448477 RepID=UPI000FD95157|nr:VWA domain-containing protein [Saccharospirillum alexandrii]